MQRMFHNPTLSKPAAGSSTTTREKLLTVVPPIVPLVGVLLGRDLLVPWVFMWLFAFSLWFGCKWMTYWDATRFHAGTTNTLVYFLAYPGMNAWAFFNKQKNHSFQGIIVPSVCALAGGIVILICLRYVANPQAQIWLGMIAIVAVLHFGTFNLAAAILNRSGFPTTPMMQNPLAATRLADFWGKRWNHDFHLLTVRYVFEPLRKKMTASGAMLLAFVFSGAIHELCITFPAQGGYGGPLAYFLTQGVGVRLEKILKRGALLRHRLAGWLYTAAFTLLPVGWLFPMEFREKIIRPFLAWMGVL